MEAVKSPRLFWSDDEKRILEELWVNPKVSQEDLQRVFPYRSWSAIEHYAKLTGLNSFFSYRKPEIDLTFYKKLMERVNG
jgi:hypothetical protein